jgi:predicted protein tyrosine phosphatase
MSDTIYLVIDNEHLTVQLVTHLEKDANRLVKTLNAISPTQVSCSSVIEVSEGMLRDALGRLVKHNKAVESQKEEV